MKKLSLLTLALSTSLMTSFAVAEAPAAAPGNPCPCPKAFSGFSFGGNLGYSFVSNTVQSTLGGTQTTAAGLTTPLSTVASKANLGMQGADGGLMVGYLHRVNNWGFGLDFLANWATTKGSVAKSTTRAGQNTPDQTAYYSAQLKNALDLRAVFGYVISNLVMPKVMLGWENAQYSLQVQENMNTLGHSKDTYTAKHRYNGFLWGAGVDFLVAKNMVCGLEYTGVVFGKKTVNYDFNAIDGVNRYSYNSSTTFKPNYTRLAVTFKFVY